MDNGKPAWLNDEKALWAIVSNIGEHMNVIAPDGTVLWHRESIGEAGSAPDKPVKCWVQFEGRSERCPHCVHPAILEDGHPREYETSLNSGTPAESCWHVRAVPLRDRSGTIRAIVELAQDVTHERHLERDRVLLERRVEEQLRMESLGVLAGGIAHEFNNRLTEVLGNLELARDGVDPESEPSARMQAAIASAQQAATVCRQILAFTGRDLSVPVPVEASSLVKGIGDVMRAVLPETAVLQLEADAELPVVNMDAEMLERALLNLVRNAVEALPGGRGCVSVRCGHGEVAEQFGPEWHPGGRLSAGHYVTIRVADDGAGMDRATMARAFDPYFSTRGAGRGLGLSVVLGTAKGCGGGVRLDSTPGRGTVVTLYLPCVAKGVTVAVGAAEAPAAAGRPRRREVLLVDDEENVRAVLGTIMTRAGYRVHVATSGEEAIDVFEREGTHIGCVILDQVMPGMSGAQVCERIREQDPRIPVLFVSGFDPDNALLERAAGERCGYLIKPFTAAELRGAVQRLLEA